MTKIQKIEMEIIRKEGKTMFRFKVPEKITAIYKGMATEIKESSSWTGLKFYSIPSMTEDFLYQRKLARYNLEDDFGRAIYNSGRLNIAWMRTVGGEGMVKVSDTVSFADLSLLIKNCTRFLKEHFEERYTDFKITGSISLEI